MSRFSCLFEGAEPDDGAGQRGQLVGVQQQSPQPGQAADGLRQLSQRVIAQHQHLAEARGNSASPDTHRRRLTETRETQVHQSITDGASRANSADD